MADPHDDQPTPQIEVAFHTHWCPLHLEPLRTGWPASSAAAMMALLELSFEHPAVIEHSGADANNLETTLREFAPLCCLVDPADMSQLYAEVGVDAADIANYIAIRRRTAPPV